MTTFRDPRACVVRVLSRDGRTAGTAFFCLPKGFLVSCAHVVDEACDSEGLVRLEFFPHATTSPIKLEAVLCAQWSSLSTHEDIAVMKLAGDLPRFASPLPFATGKPRLGALVNTYGYPAHNPVFGMPGEADFVGMTRDLTSGMDVYVVRGDSIARGFSGAPCVLIESGEVLGVVTALTTADREGRWPHGAFVTPAETVLGLCPVLTVGTPPVVQSLIQPWGEAWEPFQKYVGSTAFLSADSGIYRFRDLEEMSSAPLTQVMLPRKANPIDLIAEQLASPDPKLLIVVGAPGTGKSRLLAEMARAVCLGGIKSRLERIVPILVTARSYEQVPGNSVAERLCESLRRDAALPSARAIDAGAIDALLFDGRYRCLIMIDGADEIADSIGRKQLFKRVASDAKALLAEGHIVVLSTRPLDESGSEWMTRSSLSFRLPLLNEEASSILATSAFGEEAEKFKRLATSTGLMAHLDTPLLFNLAATLLLRRSEQLPSTILGVFQQYLLEIRSGWDNAPATAEQIIEILGELALASLGSRSTGKGMDVWLTEIDYAIQDAFKIAPPVGGQNVDARLCGAQSVVNFGLQASGLVYRQGAIINWSHLLLRDYLAALRLQTLAETSTEKVSDILRLRYSDPMWREALILFVVLEGAARRAEPWILALRKRLSGYTAELTVFVRDCIYRGAILGDDLLSDLFASFEEQALLDQTTFGSCRSLFTADSGVFWHLLRLQRIPQAQSAILRAVSRADTSRMMSEWPNSDRSRNFTPDSLYAGPLATAPAIFPTD